MLFNSFTFFIFFCIFYCIYIGLLNNVKLQNAWILFASYVFYGWWDWRFLALLGGLTLLNHVVASRIAAAELGSIRKRWVALAVVVNLGVLSVFKYFNFFIESMERLLFGFGASLHLTTLDIILPIGISFFVFEGLSYVIDVSRRTIVPASLFDYAIFQAFFPRLVAGPIERPGNLIPQFQNRRILEPRMIQAGLWLILWGLFKKTVVADNIAPLVNATFAATDGAKGGDLILAVLGFTVQIYCDFSAYSDIARGLSLLMGIQLMVNFRLPYLATSPSDFWRRWHISLSSWLRDYLYIPLGGNRGSPAETVRNLMSTMLLGGLWHGASWTFVLWGAYHGTLLSLQRLTGLVPSINGLSENRLLKPARFAMRLAQIGGMFCLTMIGWTIFRSESAAQAVDIISRANFDFSSQSASTATALALLILPLLLVDGAQALRPAQADTPTMSAPKRIFVYSILISLMLIWGARVPTEFIYFAF